MAFSIPEYRLNDDTTYPAIGFGTYRLTGGDGRESIVSAVREGYRLLDSAVNYRNEDVVGEAVRQSGTAREDIRVTSKLPGRHHAYDQALDSVQESLERMGLDYLDLYLIHWPNPGEGLYPEAWRALVEMQRRGLLRSVGVSNFLPEHLERVAEDTGVMPSVNQVEMHPYFPQEEQRAWHAEHGVLTEAWSPLGRANTLLQEPVIREAAEAHGRTPAQVILRWHHQCGVVPVPKATAPERQRENLSVFDFELSDSEMSAITGLGRTQGRLRGENPAVHQEF